MAPQSITIEHLESVLKDAGVVFTRGGHSSEVFQRWVLFEIDGVRHWIEWYTNLCTLTIGEKHSNYILFDTVVINTTWPSFRKGLTLSHEGRVVARIAVQKLQWQVAGGEF